MCCVVALFLLMSTYIAPTMAQRHISFSNCTGVARNHSHSARKLDLACAYIRMANDCHCSKEGGETIRSLVVNPCNSDPCVVPAGSSINVSFELLSSFYWWNLKDVNVIAAQDASYIIPDQNSSFMRLDPRVRLLGLELPIPGIERDACKHMVANFACPVSEGQLLRGAAPVHVHSFLPPVTAVTVWRVYGNKGLMACGATTVTVSRP